LWSQDEATEAGALPSSCFMASNCTPRNGIEKMTLKLSLFENKEGSYGERNILYFHFFKPIIVQH